MWESDEEGLGGGVEAPCVAVKTGSEGICGVLKEREARRAW